MMAWFSQASGFQSITLIFLFIVILRPAICVERNSGERLNYICIEPQNALKDEEANVPVIMLHGLCDIKETWNGIYQNISALTNRKVCIYDARNHGDSSWNDTFTIDSLVEDLEYFMTMVKIERAFLVGHSMGGQTAIKLALTKPNKVEGIFVEDIGLDLPAGTELIVGFTVRKLQKSLSAIPEGADELTAKTAVGNYMMKVLKPIRMDFPGEDYLKALPLRFQDGVWKWKTNLKMFEHVLDNLHLYITKLEGHYIGKAVFIYGKLSLFRVGDQEDNIRKLFPNAKIVGVEGANHILHFKRPEFMEELLDFLK